MPKDWDVGLGVIGDEFFLTLPKFLDWKTVFGTLGDALIVQALPLAPRLVKVCVI